MSCCQPRPRPRAGSLINKELTQYDALANVTTRRQESLRSLYDSHIVGLEAGGGGRADPQLLGLEAGGGGRADSQLVVRDLHLLRKRNFSAWSQRRPCRFATCRPRPPPVAKSQLLGQTGRKTCRRITVNVLFPPPLTTQPRGAIKHHKAIK